MPKVVGVRFRQASRVYYFDPGELTLHVGDWVVVESARGVSMAQVVIAPDQVEFADVTETLKPVLRLATQEDVEKASDARQKEKEALLRCGALLGEMNLPMKVFAAECDLDANQVTLFFRAEERVDFRDLVKRLGSELKMRVDLRQTGPRDAAKLVGGMGRCGRTLCCATFLTELTPVSIKMAKEQNLPLNPTKISGVCGRLLCCLSYEVESYRMLKKQMPPIGAQVGTPDGPAVVVATNLLREMVQVKTPKDAILEFKVAEITEMAEAAEPAPQPAAQHEQRPAAMERQKKRRRSRRKKRPAGTIPQPAGQPRDQAYPGPASRPGAQTVAGELHT